MVLGRQRRQWIINIYCYINTFGVFAGQLLSMQKDMQFDHFFKVNNYHTSMLLMRQNNNFLSFILYFLFLIIVESSVSYMPFKAINFLWILFAIMIGMKEYFYKYLKQMSHITSYFHRENYKSQMGIFKNLPQGISITDNSHVYFQTSNMKNYLAIRQSSDFILRAKELKILKENIEFEIDHDYEMNQDTFQRKKKKAVDDIQDDNNLKGEFRDGGVTEIKTGLPVDPALDGRDPQLNDIPQFEMLESLQQILDASGQLSLFQLIEILKEKAITSTEIFQIKISNCVYNDIPYDMFIRPTKFNNVNCFMVGIFDATVKNLNIYLKESNLQKSMLLGYISHNIKTPLNRIKMFLDSFSLHNSQTQEFDPRDETKSIKSEGEIDFRDREEDHKFTQEVVSKKRFSRKTTNRLTYKIKKNTKEYSALEIALSGIEELLEMNNDIRVFHDITNKSLETKKIPTNVNNLISVIIKKFQIRSVNKGVPILFEECKEYEDKTIMINQDKTNHIITNLLRNAVKHTHYGFIQIKIEKVDDTCLKLTIKDTGTGIPQQSLRQMTKQLENPYYFVGRSNREEYEEKLGLGLIVCYELAKLLAPPKLDEVLEITSEQKIGTTISFYISTENQTDVSYELNRSNMFGGNQFELEPTELKVRNSEVYNEVIDKQKNLIQLPVIKSFVKDTSIGNNLEVWDQLNPNTNIFATSNMLSRHELLEQKASNSIPTLQGNSTISPSNKKKFKRFNTQKSNFGQYAQNLKVPLEILNYDQDSSSLNHGNQVNRTSKPKSQFDLKCSQYKEEEKAVEIQVQNLCDCFDVLFVDDDHFNLLILERFARETEWRSRRAINGEDAINIILEKCPRGHRYCDTCSVILTDINMPIMNGFALSKKVKKMIRDKDIPYISLVANTANVIEEDQSKYTNFDDKFTKPFDKKQIISILKKYCKQRDRKLKPAATNEDLSFGPRSKIKKVSEKFQEEVYNSDSPSEKSIVFDPDKIWSPEEHPNRSLLATPDLYHGSNINYLDNLTNSEKDHTKSVIQPENDADDIVDDTGRQDQVREGFKTSRIGAEVHKFEVKFKHFQLFKLFD